MQSLYTFAGNKDGFKALVAAEYASVSLDLPPFRMGVDNKSSDFFKMSPRGQLPVLETQEGCLYESNAIARYIARVGGGDLTGVTAIENGEIESWIDYCSTSIDAPLQSWVYPLLKVVPRDAGREEAAKSAVASAMAFLEAHLEGRTFLVGDGVTLADIVMVCNLHLGFKLVFDDAYRKEYRNVTRYFLTCVRQPGFEKVFGKGYALCETALRGE